MYTQENMKENKYIALDIKKFIKGQCFVCNGKTDDPNAYLHYACAVAYSDEKEKRTNEATKENPYL